MYHKIHVGPTRMHIHPLPYTIDHTQLVGLALSTTATSTRYGAVISFAGNAAVMHNDDFPQSRSLPPTLKNTSYLIVRWEIK